MFVKNRKLAPLQLTERQWNYLDQRSQEEGMTLSALMRLILDGEIKRDRERRRYYTAELNVLSKHTERAASDRQEGQS